MNIFEEIINLYKNYKPDNDTIELIKEAACAKVIYAMGRNELTTKLNKILKIDYIIDDFTEEKYFEKIPIVKMKDVPAGNIVICCVHCTNTHFIIEKLNALKLRTIKYSDIYYHYQNSLDLPIFIKDTRNCIEKNINKFQEIYNKFEDEKSKQTFMDILYFRTTGNPAYLKNYKMEIVEQYFAYADFLKLSKDEIFVDCGGFDGDTSQEFIKRCPEYGKIFFFEPSKTNMLKAKKRLKNNKNIEYIDKGCSGKTETKYFNSEKGSASNISNDGDIKIGLIKIDDYIKEPYTFIKMDLEGWEIEALKGAANSIKKYKPKIAVTPYHNAKDFIEIYDYVMSLNPDYKLYLRHYTQGWSESVYFFI